MVFKLSPNADVNMTSLRGYVVASYLELEELFGEPTTEGDYKISGEWVFEDDEGNVFTLYDWKETELYDSELPSVMKFRNSGERVEFHIGGRQSAVNFTNWLQYQLSKLRENKVMKKFSDHVRAGLGS